MKLYATLFFVLFLAGCAAPEVLSRNEYGITIEHSKWAKKTAFQWADEHCASMNKKAVFMGSAREQSPYANSTWRCE